MESSRKRYCHWPPEMMKEERLRRIKEYSFKDNMLPKTESDVNYSLQCKISCR